MTPHVSGFIRLSRRACCVAGAPMAPREDCRKKGGAPSVLLIASAFLCTEGLFIKHRSGSFPAGGLLALQCVFWIR